MKSASGTTFALEEEKKRKLNKMKFHAGRRFSEVLLRLDWSVVEAAEKFKVATDTIYYWKKRPRFADSILEQLVILKTHGINPDYFELPDAPMLLEENKSADANVSAENVEALKRIEGELQKVAALLLEVLELKDRHVRILEEKLKAATPKT